MMSGTRLTIQFRICWIALGIDPFDALDQLPFSKFSLPRASSRCASATPGAAFPLCSPRNVGRYSGAFFAILSERAFASIVSIALNARFEIVRAGCGHSTLILARRLLAKVGTCDTLVSFQGYSGAQLVTGTFTATLATPAITLARSSCAPGGWSMLSLPPRAVLRSSEAS
jgi:hypothetical protein